MYYQAKEIECFAWSSNIYSTILNVLYIRYMSQVTYYNPRNSTRSQPWIARTLSAGLGLGLGSFSAIPQTLREVSKESKHSVRRRIVRCPQNLCIVSADSSQMPALCLVRICGLPIRQLCRNI